MDFLKMLRNGNRPKGEKGLEENPVPQPEEPKSENGCDGLAKSPDVDPANDAEDDDDDDFITNEVKRRLKELRRNSFMALIPEEEPCAEEEEDGEETGDTTSSDWRDAEDEGRQWWGGFDAFYEKYCERMLFFDRMSAQQLNDSGCPTPLTPSPRSGSKKLMSPLRCLSLKKIEEPDDEIERLQPTDNGAYQDLETTYVAHVCLTWEALHCQFTQLSQNISCQPESPACYNHSAQQFQQFQVLLQRFIENEPFELGLRPETFARARNILPKLLQVPNIRASEPKEMEEEGSELKMVATDLMKILEISILTFHVFLKADKKRTGNGLHLFGNQNHGAATPLQQVQSLVEKKAVKLKELRKKSKGWKKKSWPQTLEDVQLLFSLIDVKILLRVLRMERITKEQLFWCEEKLKKLTVSSSDHGKLLRRDPSPVLFPC